MYKMRIIKGHKGIAYDINADDFELLDRYMFLWQPNKAFPTVRLRLVETTSILDNNKSAQQIEAGRLLLGSQNVNDIIVYVDGDSTNLCRDNLKLFAVGTPEYHNLQQLLKEHGFTKRSFDKNPYPGVHWHMWTNKWAAYFHDWQIFRGLHDTPEAAKAAIEAYKLWLFSSDDFY